MQPKRESIGDEQRIIEAKVKLRYVHEAVHRCGALVQHHSVFTLQLFNLDIRQHKEKEKAAKPLEWMRSPLVEAQEL